MSVVARLAGWLLVAGLAVGTVLRLTLGRRRFALLLTGALLLPWSLHAAYMAERALSGGVAVWTVIAFLAAGALLEVVAVVVGRRLVAERGLLAALVPVAFGVAYGLGPHLLVTLALRRAGAALDVVPIAAFEAACLVATAALLPFAPGAAAASRRWTWPRRRRR